MRMSELYFVVVGGGNGSARQAAPLQGVAVTGLIRDAVAEYTMTQTYVNPLPNQYVEAAYTFPLYEGVAVVGFQAEVDGRKIGGKVAEKVEAREEYEEAVRDGKTAGLLEQERPDVFQVCIGSIPPKKTISIRITLVSEINHDAGENQVRFILPTIVAPRCNSKSSGFTFNAELDHRAGFGFPNWSSSPFPAPVNSKLSVNMACAMSKPITSVQSPSHTIQVHVGTTESVGSSLESYAFDPSRARVSLTENSLLDRDLVIIVQAFGLDQPRVFVERHPTEQTHALSLTFQPRFTLKPLQGAELVFLVDFQSKSLFGEPQTNRAIGEALELFLRYIPFENHYFNLIVPSTLYGSTHQAVFPTSVEFNEENLRVGVQHAQNIQATRTGTDMIASIFQEICQRRRRDVPTQIFLLTDGQIANIEEVGRTIRNAVDDGERRNKLPVRVFVLGVGNSVSHHVIESVARAGRGYAQVVMASERMEKKVSNMLKAGLTPPVTDTAIQWTDSVLDTFVMVEGEGDHADDDLDPASKPAINLFSGLESESTPVIVSESTPPPEISATVYQAPFKLPVVCPGARFTAYAILSPTTPLPKELLVRGDSPDGPVTLRVKVESVVEGETMLHSLVARALVRDFEESSSSIHALGKTLTQFEEQKLRHLGVSVAQREGQKRSEILPLTFNHVAEITKQKLIDIGVTYSLSTKYTSWVAVDEEGPRNARDVIPAGSYIINAAQCDPYVLQRCGINHTFPSTQPCFGQATPSFTFGTPPAQASSGGVCAQQAPSSALFGNFTPAFGAQCQPPFSGRAFDAASAPAFDATSAPAFGFTPGAALFGATPLPSSGTFGATQSSPFGAPQPPAFGAVYSSGGFGLAVSESSPFGAPQPPGSGAVPSSRGFGFAASETSPFRAPQPLAFGAVSSSGGFGFEASEGSLFGASTTQTAASPLSPSTAIFGNAPAPHPSIFASTYLPQQVRWKQATHQQQVVQADDRVPTSSSDPHTQLQSLLQHQLLNGLFSLVPAVADLFNTSVDNLRSKLEELQKQCTGLTEPFGEEQWEAIWATCLAVEVIKSKFKDLQGEWKLVVEKADQRVESLLKNNDNLARFKAAAKSL